MDKELDKFIKENPDDIIITGGVEEEIIHNLENELGIKLRDEVQRYLSKYGIIMGFGVEMLGCGKCGESSLLRETQRFRKVGLEDKYIVIRNVDEWIYCINNNDGNISSWDRDGKKHLIKANSFWKYILNEMVEAKENWE